MLYKNTKVKVCSLDGGTDYFDIVVVVQLRITLAPFLLIICLNYVLRTSPDLMKENGFKLTNERSRRYPAQTITDADYVDYTDTPTQAKTLLHSLEQAAGGIGLHVNKNKTEYMCFNQRGDISTLKGGPLKLVDKFTFLGSSISSNENNINAWLAIDWLSVIWKSVLTDKIKYCFSKLRSCRYYSVEALHGS